MVRLPTIAADLRQDVEQAISLAATYLLKQANRGFPESVHTMRFPRFAGFLALEELHASDVFVRAVLGAVLSNIAPQLEDEVVRQQLLEVCRREAAYVAGNKSAVTAGGWKYFPDLPELPPDIDSLSAVLTLLCAVGFSDREPYASLVRLPIDIAIGGQRPDGGFETWILPKDDPPASLRGMEHGIAKYWGGGVDHVAHARFLLALVALDDGRYQSAVEKGADYLAKQQQSDGSWDAIWYFGKVYPTAFCLEVFQALPPRIAQKYRSHIQSGCAFLRSSQNENHGWGEHHTFPLDSAAALRALAINGSIDPLAAEQSVRELLDWQACDGRWNGSAWIRMDVGRASGAKRAILGYSSPDVTTALSLQTLLELWRYLSPQDASLQPHEDFTR